MLKISFQRLRNERVNNLFFLFIFYSLIRSRLCKRCCILPDCGPLYRPPNGFVDVSNGTAYGSVAVYTCDIGYTLIGQEIRTCRLSGCWSNESPTCRINGNTLNGKDRLEVQLNTEVKNFVILIFY